jgi:hypothetical protein
MDDQVKTPDAKPREIKKGMAVKLVTAQGHRIDATCVNVRDAKKGLIDVEALHPPSHGIEKFTITASPNDPEARLPDSWHHAD